MKRTSIAVVGLAFLIASNGLVLAADKKAQKTKEEQLKTRIEAERAVQDAIKRQAETKAVETLNSKEWPIYLTLSVVMPVAGKKAIHKTDTLKFTDRKVVSKELTSKGYPESNCTFTIQDDGVVVWETMQSNPEVGLAFWRGELRGDSLVGVLSIRPKKGEMEEYSFTSVMPQETPVAVPVKATPPAKTEPLKKR